MATLKSDNVTCPGPWLPMSGRGQLGPSHVSSLDLGLVLYMSDPGPLLRSKYVKMKSVLPPPGSSPWPGPTPGRPSPDTSSPVKAPEKLAGALPPGPSPPPGPPPQGPPPALLGLTLRAPCFRWSPAVKSYLGQKGCMHGDQAVRPGCGCGVGVPVLGPEHSSHVPPHTHTAVAEVGPMLSRVFSPVPLHSREAGK